MQHTGLLITIDRTQLKELDRQFTIRMHLGFINKHVPGTIHGLDRILFTI